VQPVVWNKRTGNVVGGHQRLRALAAEGATEVDVAVVDLGDAEEKALNLALNSESIQGSWLPSALGLIDEIMGAMPGAGAALLLPDLRERVEDLLPYEKPVVDQDDVPEPPAVPTSKRGDLYILGNHRLLCGDSTNPADVARVLEGAKPRVLLTDPPYGVSLDMTWRDDAGHNALGAATKPYLMTRKDGHQNTAISGDQKADWSDAFELVPSLDVAYVWHASAFAIEVGLGLRRIGFDIKQQIIWRKPRLVLSRQHYHWQHEPCWYARKPGSEPFRGSRDQPTIWDAASPKMIMSGSTEERVDHPTQKPLVLYTRPIVNHLETGGLFYEPFGGSGSGIIAAETTERRCFSIEIDPRFVDVIVARWERLTGKKAERTHA
jgi:DNA modification methylase